MTARDAAARAARAAHGRSRWRDSAARPISRTRERRMADLEDARSGAAAPSTDSAHRPRGLSRRWVPLELGAVKRPLPGCVRRFSSCPERCRGAMLQNAGHGHGAQPVQGPERWTVAMLEEAPKRAFARAESRGARPPWVPS